MKILLAKSKQPNNQIIRLNEHTQDVIEQINNICLRSPINPHERLILNICAGLHDIGKVLPSFQKKMTELSGLKYNSKYTQEVFHLDIPHNYFSLLFIDKLALLNLLKVNKVNGFSEEQELKIILNAIGFHHWRESSLSMLLGSIDNLEKITAADSAQMQDQLKEELSTIDIEYEKNAIKQKTPINQFIKFDENLFEYLKSGGSFVDSGMITPPYLLAFLPERITQAEEMTRESTFYLGNLMRADHFASYTEGETDFRISEVEKKHISSQQKQRDLATLAKNKWGKNLADTWQFKALANNDNKNLILLAPTGSGKTEFACLFSRDLKLIFALPLKAAVNSIYERVCEIFGKDNCAILHSDARLMMYNTILNKNKKDVEKSIDESSMGTIRNITNVSRQLGYPFQICTGDQIFPVAMKYPGYERIYSVFKNACLVIDEIQAYDPRSIAIIVTMIRETIMMGAKVLLMTATLPEFLLKDLEISFGEPLENIKIDKYIDFGDTVKHKIKMEKSNLDDEDQIQRICNLAKAGKRVLVIRNKVKNAQNVFKKIKSEIENQDTKAFLLHSKFTREDRSRIEKEITQVEFKNPKTQENDGKILVATQIVEASLDIDADFLFTDIAPADSLVQRMGRIYRRYKTGKNIPQEPNVLIYYGKNKEEQKNIFGGVYIKEIVENTKKELEKIESDKGGIISEGDKLAIVNEVYSLEKIKSTPYYMRYKETLELLISGYTSDSKTEAQRLFRDIFQIPIIPIQFKSQVQSLLKNWNNKKYLDFQNEIVAKYVLGVNPYQNLGDCLEDDPDCPYIGEYHYSNCHVYNKDIGLSYEKKKVDDNDDKDNFI